jgi:hypothetical protein
MHCAGLKVRGIVKLVIAEKSNEISNLMSWAPTFVGVTSIALAPLTQVVAGDRPLPRRGEGE